MPFAVSPDDILILKRIHHGPVAQLVEHRTFNAVVAGSSPARLTFLFYSFREAALPTAACECHKQIDSGLR